MSRRDEEFYVGYLDRAPPGIGRFVARVAAAGLLGAVGVAALAAVTQAPLPPAFFEFGTIREFHGAWASTPYPALAVTRPGTTSADRDVSLLTLVGEGKHGLFEAPSRRVGSAVRLRGNLIYRDDLAMIEVESGSITEGGDVGPARVPQPVDEGRVTLVGELVDSKCFMGVMNPGSGVPHRACAIRCLSGGIPPLLALRDSIGVAAYVWVAGPEGEPLSPSSRSIATPVSVTGRLMREGDTLVLFADPGGIRPEQ